MEPALKLYDSITKSSDIQNLINQGECEGLFLECKSPAEPILGNGLKNKLATAISGFSNTEGGIIIWGVSTTKHEHGKLDVLSQKEDIGNCEYFKKQIEKSFPTLTTPSITNIKNKIIKEKSTNSKGIVITFIPKNLGDPIQSNTDNQFYFRSGDEYVKLPYEMLKRLFAATESPDLHILSDSRNIEKKGENMWKIPIVLVNSSSAIAENIQIMLEVENPQDYENISSSSFRDVSSLNQNKRIFSREYKGVIHRGINQVIGEIIVKKLKKDKLGVELKLEIEIYSNKMRAIKEKLLIYLSESGISSKITNTDYKY